MLDCAKPAACPVLTIASVSTENGGLRIGACGPAPAGSRERPAPVVGGDGFQGELLVGLARAGGLGRLRARVDVGRAARQAHALTAVHRARDEAVRDQAFARSPHRQRAVRSLAPPTALADEAR